jgi:hypothetical protein
LADDEVVVQVALAGYRDTRAGNRRRLGKAVRGSEVGARHVGREQREIEIVAPIERQAVDFVRRDCRCQLGTSRFDERCAADDGVDEGHAGRLEHDRHLDLIADREAQVDVRRGETTQLRGQVVVADWKVEDPEAARRVGDRLRYLVRRMIANLDGGARHDETARIMHDAGHRSGRRGLRARGCRRTTHTHDRQPDGRRPQIRSHEKKHLRRAQRGPSERQGESSRRTRSWFDRLTMSGQRPAVDLA